MYFFIDNLYKFYMKVVQVKIGHSLKGNYHYKRIITYITEIDSVKDF